MRSASWMAGVWASKSESMSVSACSLRSVWGCVKGSKWVSEWMSRSVCQFSLVYESASELASGLALTFQWASNWALQLQSASVFRCP